MAEVDPQYASDYDDRTTVAVKSVLIEIGQILGSYRGRFAVIGGAVPWLLLNESDMQHIGTLDVVSVWMRKPWVTASTPSLSSPS